MTKGKKISILGAGNVGSTIAYTLTMDGMASEIVLVDIDKNKAKGEALDIIQGTAFSESVEIYSGEYEDTRDSDIVIVTLGLARKPGQTRLDLTKSNIDIIKSVIPQIVKYSPDAVYVAVSNPVDILTYAITKIAGIPERQVIGSGTILDSARLRTKLAEHVGMNSKNIHAYVFGEHGDTAVIPWSLTNIAGMEMTKYCEFICARHNGCGKIELGDIENDIRTAGAQIISLKKATYYAIGMAVRRICESIIRDDGAVLTISAVLHGQYGIEDVALSLPVTIGARGRGRWITPPMLPKEQEALIHSANTLKDIIKSLDI